MRNFVVTESWRVKTLRRTENFRKPATDYGVSVRINGNVVSLQLVAKLSFVKFWKNALLFVHYLKILRTIRMSSGFSRSWSVSAQNRRRSCLLNQWRDFQLC